MLSRGHTGDAPHHRDHLPLDCQEAEDGIAVFGILKDNAMYGPFAAGHVFHGFYTFLSQFI